MGDAFKCLDDFQSTFTTKVNEAIALLDSNTCPKLTDKITNILTQFKLCQSSDCLSFWMSKIELFSEKVAEIATPDENTVTDINAARLRRMSTSTGEVIGVTSGGVNAYISDTSDAQLSIDGVTLEENRSKLLEVSIAMIALGTLLF